MKTISKYLFLQILSLGLIVLQISCGKIEYTPCADKYPECVLWKKAQLCSNEDYKDYLTFNCPVTCGKCENPKKKNDIDNNKDKSTEHKNENKPNGKANEPKSNGNKTIHEFFKNLPKDASVNATKIVDGFIITSLFNASSNDVLLQNNNNNTKISSNENSTKENSSSENEDPDSKKRSHVSFKQKFANALLHNKPYYKAGGSPKHSTPHRSHRSVKGKKSHKRNELDSAKTTEPSTITAVNESSETPNNTNNEGNDTNTYNEGDDTNNEGNDTNNEGNDTNNEEEPGTTTDAPSESAENATETTTDNTPSESEQNVTETPDVAPANNPGAKPLNANNNNDIATITQSQVATSPIVTMEPYSQGEPTESCDTRKFKMNIKNNYCDTLQDENSPEYKILRGNINKDISKFIAMDAVITGIQFPLECESQIGHSDTTVILTVCANHWTINRFKRLFSTGKVGNLVVVPNTLFEIIE